MMDVVVITFISDLVECFAKHIVADENQESGSSVNGFLMRCKVSTVVVGVWVVQVSQQLLFVVYLVLLLVRSRMVLDVLSERPWQCYIFQTLDEYCRHGQ